MMGKHSIGVRDDTRPQPLIVVGSANWDSWGAIQDAIRDVFVNHPRIQLITSGCPTGAEWFAVQEITSWGDQPAPVTMRDEELPAVKNALVLGFVKDNSAGASAALEKLRILFWTRIYRDDTYPQLTSWATR